MFLSGVSPSAKICLDWRKHLSPLDIPPFFKQGLGILVLSFRGLQAVLSYVHYRSLTSYCQGEKSASREMSEIFYAQFRTACVRISKLYKIDGALFSDSPNLDEVISKLYQNDADTHAESSEGVDIADPHSFYCKEFF